MRYDEMIAVVALLVCAVYLVTRADAWIDGGRL